MRKVVGIALVALFIVTGVSAQQKRTGWQEDGLKGKVKSIKVENGALVEKFGKWVESGSRALVESIAYDIKGNRVRSTWYSDGTTYTYGYDAGGSPTGETVTNSKGSLLAKIIYAYDGKGNRTEEAYYHPDGVLEYKTTHGYDDRGYRSLTGFYNSKGDRLRWTYFTYDNKGNLAEENRYSSPIDAYRDELGLDGDKYGYDYEFDKTGNWVKKIIKKQVTKFGKIYFEPTGEAEYRTIEYYD